MPDKQLAIFDQDTGETAEQHLWIELNREWLIRHHLYKSKRTKDEADLMLYVLFHGCREIRRPPAAIEGLDA